MRVGVAEARRRFREMLDRVSAGEVLEITRRDTVLAVLGKHLAEVLRDWRREWDVDSWPDEPFANVRDRSAGRQAPW